ncbi:MAG: sulfate ABC transporter permease subunit CysT [Rickettsiales bacterium]|jgi:sulfate transport system permease protein|nr:sulfate ABC transporter permease subunit CysT [Rickettsiales bacterium]
MSISFPNLKHPSILPGFGITMGFTLAALLVVVIIPLAGLFFKTATLSWPEIIKAVTSDRVLHAYKVSFGLALAAAAVNAFFGLILAWVLVRYRFYGRKILDAMVDLPFALPTAVAGIALATLYGPHGWIGAPLAELGIKVAFTPLGIFVALVFVGLPFVVRTVEPILKDIDREIEEAAISLGATRWQLFTRVLLPSVMPALATGFAMAFARGLGEYGSVIFIAGNIPGISEIVPLLIVVKLEQYDMAGATAIACVMLLASFALLLLINWLQKRMLRATRG